MAVTCQDCRVSIPREPAAGIDSKRISQAMTRQRCVACDILYLRGLTQCWGYSTEEHYYNQQLCNSR